MGSYVPQGYRRKEIPKANGKVRVISIPTIRDRVVQGAMLLILDPIFEVDFSDSSYGARPGRSAHQALAKVKQGLLAGRHRVLDVDLSQYFDNIRHDRVLEKVARRFADRALMRIGEEAEAIGVSINEEKTKLVSFGVPGANFAFLVRLCVLLETKPTDG